MRALIGVVIRIVTVAVLVGVVLPDLAPVKAAELVKAAPEFNRYAVLVQIGDIRHRKASMASVSYGVTAAALSTVAFGQVNLIHSVPSCAKVHRSGRRIVSQLEIVEFYIPRFAHLTKVRDVDYVEYYVCYGPKQEKLWLKLMFGPLVGGHSPDDLGKPSIQWASQKWGCHGDEDGTDWRGIAEDGRRWRHVSIPFGFAAYQNVPPKAADYFDKILDTMCCGKCPYCKK